MLDIKEIMELIPHRYPFLLVDRIIECDVGKSISAIKNVTINEHFFTGHFPKHPVFPGVLIIEALAQTAAVLVSNTLGNEAKGKIVYFTSIEKAKFRKPVFPGDQLILNVEALQNRRNLWKFDVSATVDGKTTTEATISAMIMDV